jgi:GT2 family glycosyltransferase
MERVTVVIATRDRRDGLLRTLDHLAALPERPPLIVVDNGSTDGSAGAVRAAHPMADVVALGRNVGAPARNVGVRRAATPYVAFADDDSWWQPGSLAHAADLLDAHPRLGVIAARVLVGADDRLDSTSELMRASPLAPVAGVPGRPVLGFLACGAIVRRAPFLSVGGFDDLVFFLGEEALVAMDLTAAGWTVAYVDEVVAHHHPSRPGDPSARRRRQLRNELLTSWLRRPPMVVARRTARLAWESTRDGSARGALTEVALRAPLATRRRRRLPAHVEAMARQLESQQESSLAVVSAATSGVALL